MHLNQLGLSNFKGLAYTLVIEESMHLDTAWSVDKYMQSFAILIFWTSFPSQVISTQ